MRTADFDYQLPPELIAQTPISRRDAARMLVLDRSSKVLAHKGVNDLPDLLNPGDLLVLNDSRVLPARLRAARAETGSELEILLLEETKVNEWWCMARPAKKLREGKPVTLLDRAGLPTNVTTELLERNDEGHVRLRFEGAEDLRGLLQELGELPLPPYIERDQMKARSEDWERYQTVYARNEGSVAAPTAGLHFTHELLARLQHAGIGVTRITLHVGVGTFAPVKAEELSDHRMHSEAFSISAETAQAITATKARGNRVVAVGTTTVRTLESVAAANAGKVIPGPSRTNIFIHPPFKFRVVDALLTNFHLPRSTLLMLVSAFAASGSAEGRETILRAYAEAIQNRYRFFSYGDAMLLL